MLYLAVSMQARDIYSYLREYVASYFRVQSGVCFMMCGLKGLCLNLNGHYTTYFRNQMCMVLLNKSVLYGATRVPRHTRKSMV